jgi:phosphatidylglycerol---prolipoprotein diacylglyceryl transferase
VAHLLYIPWFRAEKFEIPGLEILAIQPFGLLVATGVLFGIFMAEQYAKKHRWSPNVAATLCLYAVVFGFVSAIVLNTIFYYPERITYFIERFPTFVSDFPHSDWSVLPFTGLSSFGGFIGATIGIAVWKHRTQLPLMPIADAVAFCFPFGWFFGRTGCFVVHDHPGRETDFFLAVDNYEIGHPPYVPRHDLGLYEMIWSAGMVILFLFLVRKPRKPGVFVALVPTLYSPIRFLLDYLRVEKADGGDARYLGLTPGQYSAIAFLLLGVWLMRRALVLPAEPLPESIRWNPESGEPPPPTPRKPSVTSAAVAEKDTKGKGKKRKKSA